MSLLGILRPLAHLMPTVPKSPVPLNIKIKTLSTATALFIYLICAQIPIYGIERSREADPLHVIRVIMASSRGTLMEFGISPIISAGWITMILSTVGLLKVVTKQDQKDLDGIEKVIGIIFCFGQAAGAIFYGAYGPASSMSITTMILIIAQLIGAGFVVILLDDMLRKGYGLGSGISLFIVANTSQTIFWYAFSPVTMSSEFGVQFEGSFIALIHFLFTKDTIWQAVHQAFTRQNGFNLASLVGSLFIFLVMVYMHRFKKHITFINQRYPGFKTQIPIKLFFTSNMSVILQSLFISFFYNTINTLHDRFHNSNIIKLLGTWEQGKISGGILWYVAPPQNMTEAFIYPHRTIFYTAFVCFLCSVFARFWIVISKSTPMDYAKSLRNQQLTLPNYKERSNIEELQNSIPVAAMLGGVTIGFLTVVGDLLNVAGSSAGILLSISILYGYYQKANPDEDQVEDF